MLVGLELLVDIIHLGQLSFIQHAEEREPRRRLEKNQHGNRFDVQRGPQTPDELE